MSIVQYIENTNKKFQSGISSEHSYRSDLELLIKTIVPSIEITNEPSNITDCGNPDFVITKESIPIGFIEAKDIGKDLNSKQYKEQFDRYKSALDNLIITDYLWFLFYQNGELISEIKIGEINIDGNKIVSLEENFEEFIQRINEFSGFVSQTIKSPKKLAEMMAAKARLLEKILENALNSDEQSEQNTTLQQQYLSFKEILIHDLSTKGFADIYAQTLAYGMFAARLHDQDLNTFSRQEAAELIPKSNPFLRMLFSHVAGIDIDERIVTTVDNLADVFRATNVKELLKNLGGKSISQDPVIHFYETFLSSYDPKLRKKRGVWYTPEPVVNFIVRNTNNILKDEFKIPNGIADTSKIKTKIRTDKKDQRTKSGYLELEKDIHKVQILDAATGTGTFLAEIIKIIYNENFSSIQGAWSSYVEEHLIPRLNGFEILMASYAMAHLKLDLLLKETGYIANKNPRFNIFLTNSLEEHHPDTGTLFSVWLGKEANEANKIKRDAPVMIAIGNPPYSGHSSNMGNYAKELVEKYKVGFPELYRPGQAKWLSDDYVKFISYSEELIKRNGEGLIAMITNHSYLSNPTFKGMRKSLLESFDKLYIIDLHGNNKTKETPPEDILKDENVFDIQQGVCILFAIKLKGSSGKYAEVFRHDLWGSRKQKYEVLKKADLETIDFENISPQKPYYYFYKTDIRLHRNYMKGFSLSEIMIDKKAWGPGMVSTHDQFAISFTREELISKIESFIETENESEARKKWRLCSQNQWNYHKAKSVLSKENWKEQIVDISYRPFDIRKTVYNPYIFVHRRERVSSQFLDSENIGLCFCRQTVSSEFHHAFVTTLMADDNYISNKSRERGYILPLYIEKKEKELSGIEKSIKVNFEEEFIEQFAKKVGFEYSISGKLREGQFSHWNIFDYIYGVLHSNRYREKYKQFLSADFPRIPFPKSADIFIEITSLGRKLRKLHLLQESGKSCQVEFPESGSNIVTRKINKKDVELDSRNNIKIWVNDEQYFQNIPTKAWEFSIGGYKPAQKWLKDRTGRKLDFNEIIHYQKIINALYNSLEVMENIDLIDIE